MKKSISFLNSKKFNIMLNIQIKRHSIKFNFPKKNSIASNMIMLTESNR